MVVNGFIHNNFCYLMIKKYIYLCTNPLVIILFSIYIFSVVQLKIREVPSIISKTFRYYFFFKSKIASGHHIPIYHRLILPSTEWLLIVPPVVSLRRRRNLRKFAISCIRRSVRRIPLAVGPCASCFPI